MRCGLGSICHTITDPSRASLMAVVGAFVARKLGIPCVIGTNNGTQVLHDGDIIAVGDTTGTVTEPTQGVNTLPFDHRAFWCAPPPGRPPAAERGPDRPGE
jgi:PEP-utilizing family enzyme